MKKTLDPFEVVAAIIVYDNKILCVQRGESKHSYLSFKYEFPGGKVEVGETREDAIIREIKEELKMEIQVHYSFLSVKHHYPDVKLKLHSFICTCEDPTVILTEHKAYQWLLIEELTQLDWAKADEPVVEKLQISRDLLLENEN